MALQTDESKLYSLLNGKEYGLAYQLVVSTPEILDNMTMSEVRSLYRNLSPIAEEQDSNLLDIIEDRIKGLHI
jgi:hypothetical protein